MADREQIALESAEDIEEMRAQTGTGEMGLCRIWLIYGGLQVFSALFGYLGVLFIMSPAQWIGQFFMLFQGAVVPAILAACYVFLFKRGSWTADREYRLCLALWGLPALVLPVLVAALKTAMILFPPSALYAENVARRIEEAGFLIDIILLCLCYIICGWLFYRKRMAFAGLAILAVYLVLNMFSDLEWCSITFPYQGGSRVHLAFSELFYYLSMVFGYLAAALIVKRQLGGEPPRETAIHRRRK